MNTSFRPILTACVSVMAIVMLGSLARANDVWSIKGLSPDAFNATTSEFQEDSDLDDYGLDSSRVNDEDVVRLAATTSPGNIEEIKRIARLEVLNGFGTEGHPDAVEVYDDPTIDQIVADEPLYVRNRVGGKDYYLVYFRKGNIVAYEVMMAVKDGRVGIGTIAPMEAEGRTQPFDVMPWEANEIKQGIERSARITLGSGTPILEKIFYAPGRPTGDNFPFYALGKGAYLTVTGKLFLDSTTPALQSLLRSVDRERFEPTATMFE